MPSSKPLYEEIMGQKIRWNKDSIIIMLYWQIVWDSYDVNLKELCSEENMLGLKKWWKHISVLPLLH